MVISRNPANEVFRTLSHKDIGRVILPCVSLISFHLPYSLPRFNDFFKALVSKGYDHINVFQVILEGSFAK